MTLVGFQHWIIGGGDGYSRGISENKNVSLSIYVLPATAVLWQHTVNTVKGIWTVWGWPGKVTVLLLSSWSFAIFSVFGIGGIGKRINPSLGCTSACIPPIGRSTDRLWFLSFLTLTPTVAPLLLTAPCGTTPSPLLSPSGLEVDPFSTTQQQQWNHSHWIRRVDTRQKTFCHVRDRAGPFFIRHREIQS